MKRLLLYALGLLLMAPGADALIIQTFTTSSAGTISGPPGSAVTSGTGTATLDDSGLLTLIGSNLTLGTIFANPVSSTQTTTSTIVGSLTGPVGTVYTLSGNTGTLTINTCVDLAFPACGLATIGTATPSTPPDPLAIDVAPGATTSWVSTAVISESLGLVSNSTTTLTAVPEPGTALLLLAGLAGLVHRRQRA